jgi:hypothetical protein
MLLYNSAGVQLYGANLVYSENNTPASLNAGVYGGQHYLQTAADQVTTALWTLTFDPTVARVAIGISSKTRWFKVLAMNGKPRRYTVIPQFDGRKMQDAIPVVFTNVTYVRGEMVHKMNAGSTAPPSWVYDGAAWKPLPNVP